MELRRINGLPQYVFDIVDEWKADAARRGLDIVDFGIGSPDFGTPDPIVERLVAESRQTHNHGYPTSPGMVEVREALAAWYERRYGVYLDPATQALVTWGASEALAHLPWVLLGPGDTALVPEPCYPIHRYAVLFSGAAAIGVPVETNATDDANGVRGTNGDNAAHEADDSQLLARLITAFRGARPQPRAILLSFPHNPTTRCVDLEFFECLVDFARRNDVIVIHDFAYAEIAFDGYRPPSILQVPGASDVAVELISLSKSHNMAGWRLGFVAGNEQVVDGLRRLKSYLDYGVSKPIQLAALTALTECEQSGAQMASVYQQRRDCLCDGLTNLGWPVSKPRGTMFVWARLPESFRALGSLAFTKHLLDVGHVAMSPGVCFGAPDEQPAASANEHVRLALVQSEARIQQALRGIQLALAAPPA